MRPCNVWKVLTKWEKIAWPSAYIRDLLSKTHCGIFKAAVALLLVLNITTQISNIFLEFQLLSWISGWRLFNLLVSFCFLGQAAPKWKCSNCLVSYETIGCYKETQPRQLPNEILNARDKNSKNFRGMLLDWVNWNEFIADFACRCAYETKARGWTVFGLQFWGKWIYCSFKILSVYLFIY